MGQNKDLKNSQLYIEARTVSLNDLIAAEESTGHHTARRSKLLHAAAGTTTPANGKKTSLLKYRKNYQRASPDKPKTLNIIQQLRNKRKNLNKKREIKHNDGIIQKYIPLLKNIRLLVGNILSAESGEAEEPREEKYKRNLHAAKDRDIVCTCARKSSIHPKQETITSTPTVPTEIQETTITSTVATTTQAPTTVHDNISSIGRHKDISVLPSRNSTSLFRNHNGFSERDSSSFNGSSEGHIARDNGNNERDSREEAGPNTENYEEHTSSDSRDGAGRDRSSERLRRIGIESRDTEFYRGNIQEDTTIQGSETFENITGYLPGYEREIEYEVRRDEAESSLSIPELDTGLRGFDYEEKAAEISKESVTENSASDQRFFDRNGSFTAQNQEVSSANEAVGMEHILPNSSYPVGKIVMIFDGYSVAKDVNGANRITEKAIQIHT